MQSARRHLGADFGAQFVDQPQTLLGLDVPENPAVAGARALRHRADSLRRVMRLPDGQIRSASDCPLSSLLFKKIPFRAYPKSNLELPRPVPQRGGSRSSRTRDGMRWTRTALQTSGARGGRRSRVVLTPRRWRQVGGGNSVSDGGKQARSPGRARRKPLKPLRGECRVFRCDRGD
jgi:hypothetical protein